MRGRNEKFFSSAAIPSLPSWYIRVRIISLALTKQRADDVVHPRVFGAVLEAGPAAPGAALPLRGRQAELADGSVVVPLLPRHQVRDVAGVRDEVAARPAEAGVLGDGAEVPGGDERRARTAGQAQGAYLDLGRRREGADVAL